MVDSPIPDGTASPYERRGLYAVAVSEVPSADVEGRRAASVWGVIWRSDYGYAADDCAERILR